MNKLTYCVRKAVKFENKNKSEDDFLILFQKYFEKTATVHAVPMKTVQEISMRKNTKPRKNIMSIQNPKRTNLSSMRTLVKKKSQTPTL
jgi:hypothetical protein